MATADSHDEFFLNFGSSTNVCDQLRHSIRQEVSDIDVSIGKVEEEKHKEDRTNNELNKSLCHGRKEMYNLRRFASDIHDSANMNETLRIRMMEDLAGELVNPYLKGKDKDGDAAIDDTTGCPSSSTSIVFLEERQEEINLFTATTTKSKTDTIESHHKNLELVKAKEAVLQVIETEQLKEKVSLGEREIEDLCKSLENEQRRVRITKEALHDARTKSGMHAQEIADYTKTLTAKKAKHEAERHELTALLIREESELLELERDDGVQKKMRDINYKLDTLDKQKEDANEARNHRIEVDAKIDVVKKENAILEATVATAEEVLVKRREACSLGRDKHNEAKSFQEQVGSQKAHNDRVQAEKIVPGQQESQNLKKEKETLAHGVTDSSSKRESILKNLNEKIEVKEALVQKLSSEIKAVSDENEEACTAFNHLQTARDELQAATKKECAENVELVRNFAAAQNAEETHQRELETKAQNNRESKLSDARAKSALHRQQQEEFLELLYIGADMIKLVRAVKLENDQLEASHHKNIKTANTMKVKSKQIENESE